MRKEVLEDGAFKKVAKVLLEPIVRHKPEDVKLKAFLNQVFGAADRSIKRYVVKKPFKMPGLYHISPNVKRQSMGPRNTKAGSGLFIRTDKNSDFIDIEPALNYDPYGGWFSMDFITFNREVLPHIELDPRDAK